MFFHRDIKGDQLPPKTICLTYDDGPGETPGDGPGPNTRELGRFLHAHHMRGYRFVGLDAIPQVQEAVRASGAAS
jgi:hypothetical protein